MLKNFILFFTDLLFSFDYQNINIILFIDLPNIFITNNYKYDI